MPGGTTERRLESQGHWRRFLVPAGQGGTAHAPLTSWGLSESVQQTSAQTDVLAVRFPSHGDPRADVSAREWASGDLACLALVRLAVAGLTSRLWAQSTHDLTRPPF